MCDLAKVADLALLLVDGAYGFQLETFGAHANAWPPTPLEQRIARYGVIIVLLIDPVYVLFAFPSLIVLLC